MLLACADGPSPPEGEAAGEDLCRLQAVVPLSPRLVAAPLYGEPRVIDGAVCAACFVGAPGAWAAGDRELFEVHAGDLFLEVPNDGRSRLRASHALSGATLGRGAALVDLGERWLLWQEGRGARMVAPPLLGLGEVVWGVTGGEPPILVVGNELSPQTRVEPLDRPLAHEAPVTTLEGRTVGHVDRALEGAAVLASTGARVALGDARGVHGATLVGDAVIAWATRETVVAVPGEVPERVGQPDLVLADAAGVVVVEQAARRVRRWSNGGWSTVAQARARADLAGVALAEGAQAIRLGAALAHGHLAVVERVRTADCGAIDSVYVVDLETGGLRTVASDGHLRLHIAPIDEGFGWVEADVGWIQP